MDPIPLIWLRELNHPQYQLPEYQTQFLPFLHGNHAPAVGAYLQTQVVQAVLDGKRL